MHESVTLTDSWQQFVARDVDEAVASGKVQRGDLILIVAFGAGLTWGAAIIEW